MSIRSVLVIVWCVYLSETSLAQSVYEIAPPDPFNCYYIDTYKTDFGPGDELVRPERSFMKKLFKHLSKSDNECVPCCANSGGYNGGAAGDGAANGGGNGYYPEGQQYDNGYGPGFNPQDVPIGHHGHIYLPLPHPHRVMSNIFNRPFRRGYGGFGGYGGNGGYGGYGGKVNPAGNYPPRGPPVEVKPDLPPPKADTHDAYQEPAPVEPPPEAYGEEPAYASEDKHDQKEEYVDKSDGDKKYEKEDTPSPEPAPAEAPAPAPAPAPVTPQIIQPIVPIIAPPVYIYPPQYYTPPVGQPVSYGQPYIYSPLPPSPVAYPAAPASYPTYSQETSPVTPVQYQPPAPTYTQVTPPVTSVEPFNSPPALVYPAQDPIYSPPAPSYSQVSPRPTYTSPPVLTYSPSPSLTLPLLEEPTLPCPFLNPSDSGYYKKTYSTSLTYMMQQSPSPPPPPSPPSYYIPCYDQPMSSCPELFTSYQLGLQESLPPVSHLC